MILDSGNRTEFASGAVRDTGEGKGDCSLLPLLEAAEFLSYVDQGDMSLSGSALAQFARFIEKVKTGETDKNLLFSALYRFAQSNDWDAPTMLLELSIHFEEGAKKYARDNWRRGIPISSFASSGVRHYLKWKAGYDDERHDRAVCWNWMCLLWTLKNKPECNDIVTYTADAVAGGIVEEPCRYTRACSIDPVSVPDGDLGMSPEAMANVLSMWNTMFTQNPFSVSNMGDFPNGEESEK